MGNPATLRRAADDAAAAPTAEAPVEPSPAPRSSRPRDMPAPWAALDWRPLVEERNSAKTRVYVAEQAGRRVVCKDASLIPSPLARWFRGHTVRHEARILARLAGIEGVPRLLGSWRRGFVMEALPGRMLTSWREGRPPPARCFDDLDRIVEEVHVRDVLIGDLHRRNVLVDDDGRAYLVDFEVAMDTRRGVGRLLRGYGVTLDRLAAARQRRRFGAALAPEQAALLARPPWTYRVVKGTRGALLRWLRGSRRGA